jgi:hypothetical protein
MSTRLLSCVAVLLVAGCIKQKDPYYCPGANPNDNCAEIDAGTDGPQACTSNDQCAPLVCDVSGSMVCAQCTATDHDACSAATPVCGQDLACRGCTAHAECASNACLPDGSCGDDSNVAYVDPNGTDNVMCTKAMPCTMVTKALATNRPYLKLKGTTDEAVTVDSGRVVTFLGDPSAKLTRAAGGAIVTVRDTGTSLAIYDLAISDAPNNASGFGVVIPTASGAPTVSLTRVALSNNPGGGISSSGGSLTVTQSTISGNTGGGISSSGGSLTVTQSTILLNSGGGVSIGTAQFDLTNNVIARNGSAGSTFGGLFLTQTNTGTRRFEFNTVTQNQATTGITPGVLCAAVATPIPFASSVVFGNSAGTQVEGSNCSWTYSDIGPTTASGSGNINVDPMFVNPAQNNFHLMASSPAKDVADPAATLGVDLDGNARPQGAGRDMGADEITP